VIKLNGHCYLKDYEMRDAITDAREIFYLYMDHACPINPPAAIKHMDSAHRTYVLSVFDDILNLLNRLYEIADEEYVKLEALQAELEITMYEAHNISNYDEYVMQKNSGTHINDSAYRRFLYNVCLERSTEFLKRATP
jgi:hypothetical protein